MSDIDNLVDAEPLNELPVANIVVAGITGAGKSTLLNAVFGEDKAKTGQGKAITEHMNEYHEDNCPIRIWDTVGLEIDSAKTEQSIRAIRQKIEEKALSKDGRDCIHAIWYCINSGSNRYQEAEIRFISSLYNLHVPFIIVLTQCIDDQNRVDQFESIIREENIKHGMDDIEIVQVLAQDMKTRLGTIENFGLDRLVNVTIEKLPKFLVSSFIAAQNVSRENKRGECEKIILDYVKSSLEGKWDNIWLLNIPGTYIKIKGLLLRIALVYDRVLCTHEFNWKALTQNLSFEDIWNGLIVPWQGEYGKRVQEMFEKKVGNGYEGDFMALPKRAKAARLIAYYGCIFIDSVEETWNWKNTWKIKNINDYCNEVVRRINKHLEEEKTKKKILVIR